MARYQNLIKNNQQATNKIESIRAEGEDVTHLYLYGVIDPFWGVSAEDFVKELNSIETDEIVIHINSPGGFAFDGQAMAAEIKNHKSVITAQITGLCASAATIVAIACDEVRMDEGAFFMIHNAWAFVIGDKNDMMQESGVLDKIDQSLAKNYANRTGMEVAEVSSLMDAETWFLAEEALEKGFIDQVMEADDSEPENRYNVAAYENAPAALKKAAEEPKAPPVPDLSNQHAHALAKSRAAQAVSR